MFYATNRLYVLPEKAEEFEGHFIGNMRTYLPGVDGLRRSTLLRPDRPEHPYVSINEFDTEEQFRTWISSDSFQQAHARNKGIARHVSSNAVETFEPLEDLVL